MTKTKTVMLPTWIDRESSAYAHMAMEIDGISKNNPKYGKAFKKAKHEFCLEAYKHSMIPAQHNPGSSPRVADSVFALIPILFSDKSKFMQSLPTERERLDVKRRLRSAITHLTQIYVKTILGLKNEDFEYPKNASTEAQKKVEINRYARLYVALNLVKALTKPLLMNKNIVLENLATLGINANLGLSHLKSKEARHSFISKVMGKEGDLVEDAGDQPLLL